MSGPEAENGQPDTDTQVMRVAAGMCRWCGVRSFDGPDGFCEACR